MSSDINGRKMPRDMDPRAAIAQLAGETTMFATAATAFALAAALPHEKTAPVSAAALSPDAPRDDSADINSTLAHSSAQTDFSHATAGFEAAGEPHELANTAAADQTRAGTMVNKEAAPTTPSYEAHAAHEGPYGGALSQITESNFGASDHGDRLASHQIHELAGSIGAQLAPATQNISDQIKSLDPQITGLDHLTHAIDNLAIVAQQLGSATLSPHIAAIDDIGRAADASASHLADLASALPSTILGNAHELVHAAGDAVNRAGSLPSAILGATIGSAHLPVANEFSGAPFAGTVASADVEHAAPSTMDAIGAATEPLHLSFLGQSYAEEAQHHDGVGGILHGLI